jgi:hypothetical protein
MNRDDELIERVETWLQETREPSPPGLAFEVSRAIRSTPRTAGRREDRWAWIPAALAMAAVLLLVLKVSLAPQPAAAPSPVRCDFRLEVGTAKQVCLVGNFNGWAVCRTPLRAAGDGTWEVSLELPPGRYEYMYVVDGQWESDPEATQYVDDGFGNRNAVLLL